jgi:hypothetical protein
MADTTELAMTLRSQHDVIRRLLADVRATAGAQRRRAFDALSRFLAAHEGIEVEAMHTPVRDLLADPDVARARIHEETTAMLSMAHLEGMDVDGLDFVDAFDQLSSSIDAHAEAEEHEELPAIAARVGQGAVDRIHRALETVPRLAELTPEVATTFEARVEAARQAAHTGQS